MTINAFDSVVDYLEKRNSELVDIQPEAALSGPRYRNSIKDLNYNEDTKVGFIEIDGPLTYVPHYALCAGESASYQRILADATTMLESGAKVLVIDADSPGGQAYGMMESAADLRNLADTYGAKLITYADGLIASAMYGIAATSHEIIINPEGEAGSIGVVVSLANNSEKERKEGVKRTYITAGEGKVPFTDEGEFTDSFKEDIQAKVDSLYDKFTNHVSQYRELSKDTVKSYGAKVYEAQEALEKGLVDKIMTRIEFSNYLADIVEESSESNSMINFKSKQKDKNMSVEKVAELEASLQKLQADYEASTSQLTEAQTQLKDALAQLTKMEEEKKQAKVSDRKVKLEKAVGEKEAAKLMSSLTSLSDEDFDVTLSFLAAKADDLDDAEKGANGEEQDPEKDLTAEILKQETSKNKGAK